MSSPTRALVRLELQSALPWTLVVLAVLAALPLLPWVVTGEMSFVGQGYADLCLLVLVPALAASLGGEAVAADRASGAWSFLTARAVSRKRVLIVKLAVRGSAALVALAGAWAIARAWTRGPIPWLEAADLPAASGIVLAVLATVACFACGFAAGLKLADSVSASLLGMLGGVGLTLLVLLPGALMTGSLAGALSSPREWLAIRAARDGRGTVQGFACLQRSALGVAFQLEDRAAILPIEQRGRVPKVLALPRGTRALAWVNASLLVSFPEGDRLVDMDGATRPDEGEIGTCDSPFAAAVERDGRLLLLRGGTKRLLYPPEAP
jgi:hypothetical protein